MSMNLNAPQEIWMFRENIKIGMEVGVVRKKDQRTGKLTFGKVRWILTSKDFHSRGIKVIIETREVGRVQKILTDEQR
jgi:uncharacterized repeat protein (TIGR03833 family)